MVESQREIPGSGTGAGYNRARDALLYRLIDLDRSPDRAGYPSPSDDRERPSLGLGYDFSRRRMPGPHRSRTRQLHRHQTHGLQPHPKSLEQRFQQTPPQCRRLGRRLLGKSSCGLNLSTDSPGGWPNLLWTSGRSRRRARSATPRWQRNRLATRQRLEQDRTEIQP